MPVFITFEGVEGAGKSTSIKYFSSLLETKNIAYVLTREPGGTQLGEQVRNLLLSKDIEAMHADTEALLMFAARAEHLNKVILPELNKGNWVLCDRFTDASYAYQGTARGLGREKISSLETFVQGNFRPNNTLLFDVDAKTGMQRVRKRGETDRFEEQEIDFFNQVRECYLQLAESDMSRYITIDASQTIQSVEAQLDVAFDAILRTAK